MSECIKVMVVDDEPVTLEVTRALLESRGYDVVTRESAIGTTAAILRERPDVVLLDILLPGLPGDQLLKAITEEELLPEGQRPAFILYSGVDGSTLHRLVEETGALGGIEKTADLAGFASAFEALLQRAREPGSGTAA
jgi:CheY-like chemotaxis protein